MLDQAEDRLLFILIYLKTNPLQTMHGLQFGLSQPQTNYWIHHLLPVVQAALQELDLTRNTMAAKSRPARWPWREPPTWRSTVLNGDANGPETPLSNGPTTAARKRPIPTRISCWSTRVPTR